MGFKTAIFNIREAKREINYSAFTNGTYHGPQVGERIFFIRRSVSFSEGYFPFRSA